MESEWNQLQALEELCRQQREALERKTHFQAHSHSNESLDLQTFNGHNETTPDDTDFEYITAIWELFTGFKTTQPQKNQRINQNFAAK